MQVWTFVAILAGLAALGFGVYLAAMLGSIRKKAFGEGRRLELPEMGVAMRIPAWWKVEDTPGQAGRTLDGNDATPAGRVSRSVRLMTGHRRGLVTIEPLAREEWPQSADSEALLKSILQARGHVLDSLEFSRDRRQESSGVSRNPAASSVSWVSVSSAGVEAAEPEVRTYFELHLADVGGRPILLTYTNSVLQGFLDAFYIQRVLETLEPAAAPGL